MGDYKIEYNGKVIAWFLHKADRDFTINALREAYPDCGFLETNP